MHRANCWRCGQISVLQRPRNLSIVSIFPASVPKPEGGALWAQTIRRLPACWRGYATDGDVGTLPAAQRRGPRHANSDWNESLEHDNDQHNDGGKHVPGSSLHSTQPNLSRAGGEWAGTKRAYRRSGSEKVAVDARPLTVQTLGQPAQAIVMRGLLPRPAYKGKDSTPVSVPPQMPLRPFGEDLARKRGVASLNEARSNLDELCPQFAASLPHREFKALADTLLDGFTVPQLQYYADTRFGSSASNSPAETPSVMDLKDVHWEESLTDSSSLALKSSPMSSQSRYSWVLKQSSWTPLQGYDFPISTPREKLVRIIMQDCWKLRVQELLDGRGRLVVQAGERILKLLLSTFISLHIDWMRTVKSWLRSDLYICVLSLCST